MVVNKIYYLYIYIYYVYLYESSHNMTMSANGARCVYSFYVSFTKHGDIILFICLSSVYFMMVWH